MHVPFLLQWDDFSLHWTYEAMAYASSTNGGGAGRAKHEFGLT
jgi:hypothetical protein